MAADAAEPLRSSTQRRRIAAGALRCEPKAGALRSGTGPAMAAGMLTPSVLLLLIGVLGAIDIAYFHSLRGRLVLRPESRREAWIHVLRGFVYAAQFLSVPSLVLTGRWYLAYLALFALDVGVAVADVLEEPSSRAAQGGLSGGEYLMHIVLSVLAGAFLCAFFRDSWAWHAQPTGVALSTSVPQWLRGLLRLMALGAASVSLIEALVLIGAALGPAAPLHVRVRVRAPLERLWDVTQDHRLHPSWDHRFSRIEMVHEDGDGRFAGPPGTPDPRIRAGTVMRYEKTLLGVTIRGLGRYKLHRPMQQSTFEFWSDDPRSLIRRGVGLWLYRPVGDGTTELSTSYTYDVRWGPLGRLIDRVAFRPLFQRYTEQSFRRLARWFGEARPQVLGRDGRRPRRFAAQELS
jgi:hypothetical protein